MKLDLRNTDSLVMFVTFVKKKQFSIKEVTILLLLIFTTNQMYIHI